MSDMTQKPDQLNETEEQERLSRRLRESREYLGLSQEFVADYLGIPRASISALETGKRKGPLELHQKIARSLRVPLDLLAPTELADPARFAKRRRAIAEKKREGGGR